MRVPLSTLRGGFGDGTAELKRWGKVEELANPKRLLLDFDQGRTPSLRAVWAACRIVGVRPEWVRHDRTKRGWHVVIQLRESLLPGEQIALQAVMGSDRRRETLNLMRAVAVRRADPGVKWRNRWQLLFSEKVR